MKRQISETLHSKQDQTCLGMLRPIKENVKVKKRPHNTQEKQAKKVQVEKQKVNTIER